MVVARAVVARVHRVAAPLLPYVWAGGGEQQVSLQTGGLVIQRLEEIERDLAEHQNDLEEAAMDWFRVKREKERERARAFIGAEGTVAERSAKADIVTAMLGAEEEARYEALRGVVRVLETRASIGQSLLRSQTREAYGASSAAQPAWSNNV